MEVNGKLRKLINEYQFNEGTAKAYIDSKGKCVYCGKDLLSSLSDFLAADIDHLLPKSKYPEVDSNIDNWVLSCRACNSMKGKANFLNIKWEPEEAIKNHKNELIKMIRDGLEEKRKLREEELNKIRQIIQNK